MLNERNQIHYFISSSGSGTVINYGSGSTSQKVTVPPVPVPQHCYLGHWEFTFKYTQVYAIEETKSMRIKTGVYRPLV